ncbi:hypothetical protein CEXT_209751 [Caerostris extrusa]|uniref:Uncharacterized protein n=1 Tax=Caerostris extrusa TaxID=172846 RepID=A0AAV4VT98_CAEEX|nr:hypothetical protein CEXT_209751 [Caerostris extrusa]
MTKILLTAFLRDRLVFNNLERLDWSPHLAWLVLATHTVDIGPLIAVIPCCGWLNRNVLGENHEALLANLTLLCLFSLFPRCESSLTVLKVGLAGEDGLLEES